MKTIHRIVRPQQCKLMKGRMPTFHPTLLLIQAFDQNGQRVWYSQEKVGNSTINYYIPVEWDITNINPNLVGVWQAAEGTLTLPEDVELHPDVRVIMPFIFLENFTDPYPDVPASMLNVPVNINTASREEIMTLPIAGGMRTQNQRVDLIMNNRPFASVDEIEPLVGRVALINCKYVGITTEDVVIESEEPFLGEVMTALNDFQDRLNTIEDISGVGPVLGGKIRAHFEKA